MKVGPHKKRTLNGTSQLFNRIHNMFVKSLMFLKYSNYLTPKVKFIIK